MFKTVLFVEARKNSNIFNETRTIFTGRLKRMKFPRCAKKNTIEFKRPIFHCQLVPLTYSSKNR